MIDASGWSYVLKDIPRANPNNGGFNYLGLGVIILVVISIFAIMSKKVRDLKIIKENVPLIIMCVGLTIFAISNKVAIGLFEFEYEIPDGLLSFANVFRASGRMFWPVLYLIMLVGIAIVVKGFSKRAAGLILGFVLLIQIVDTSSGWLPIRKKLMQEPRKVWDSTLVDNFWEIAATRYTKIRYIPIENKSPEWRNLAYFAATHKLETDAVYLARVGKTEIENAQTHSLEKLRNGNYDLDTLYILDDKSFNQALLSIDKKTTLQLKIDGLNVVAPGWYACNLCRDYINPSKMVIN